MAFPESAPFLEKEPSVTVEFLFAPHNTAHDARLLKDSLKEADVYVPERLFFSQSTIERMNRVAQGQPSEMDQRYVHSLKRDSFEYEQYRLLWKSQKEVVCIDIPKDSRPDLEQKWIQMDRAEKDADRAFLEGDLESCLIYLKTRVALEAEIEREREKVMAQNLEQEKLKRQEAVDEEKTSSKRILVTLGSFHEDLDEKYPTADSSRKSSMLTRAAFHFSSLDESVLRTMLGEPVSDLLLARGIFEKALQGILDRYSKSSENIIGVAKSISAKVGLGFIKDICRELQTSRVRGLSLEDVLRQKLLELDLDSAKLANQF